MKNLSEHIDLIVKFLSGSSTSEESKMLFDLMEQDEDLKKEFESLEKTWKLSAEKPDDEISSIDLDAEWNLFDKNIDKTPAKIIPIDKNRSFSWTKIASAVAAVFVLGFAVFYFFNLQTNELVADNQIIETGLPDGSHITLNKGSVLEYRKNFNQNKRTVKLKGEAFFKVAHNPEKPFVVKAGKLSIEVVGTEFNVDARSRKGNVEVVVNEGKVLVYSKPDKSDGKLLVAGDKAEFSSQKHLIVKKRNTNPNFLAWKTKKLVFEKTSLSDIVRTLSKTYNVQIIIKNPALKNCTLTNTFDNQALESVFKVLEATLDIHIYKKGKAYVIDGKACNK